MKMHSHYEVLVGKSPETVIRELEQLIGAAKITMTEGIQWLLTQRDPNGPIMRDLDVSFVYKAVWAAYATNQDRHYITGLLDWLYEKALQPNGDFFFPEEVPLRRTGLRAYRMMVFLKFAALLDHPIIHDEKVLRRIKQYQDMQTGGCFYYIGEDPKQPELPGFIRIGETAFFGEFAMAAGLKDEALKAGSWMLKMVQDNHAHMIGRGVFYTETNRNGELITDVAPGENIFRTVNNWDANQPGWMVGCAMVLLADLYDTMREKWKYEAREAQPYLEAALSLLDFEDTMPVYTYFWPSKCKIAWGTGMLLRVLLKYKQGTEEQYEKLYRASKRVFLHTFLGTQLPDGSWGGEHYPLKDNSPEVKFDYRVIKGLTLYPPEEMKESTTSIYISPVEITGEFLGEIGAMTEGLTSLLEFYRDKNNLGSAPFK